MCSYGDLLFYDFVIYLPLQKKYEVRDINRSKSFYRFIFDYLNAKY